MPVGLPLSSKPAHLFGGGYDPGTRIEQYRSEKPGATRSNQRRTELIRQLSDSRQFLPE
jgi:hypothetical protein